MAFATAQNVVDRIDVRWLGDLIFDDNTRGTEAQVLASTRLAACLEDAAGIILAYALQGERYSREDLASLTDEGLALLIRLNVDMAATLLAEGRQVPQADIEKTIPGYGRSMAMLQQLQLGNVIFEVATAGRAGVPNLAYQSRGSNITCNVRRLFGDVGRTEDQNDGIYPPCGGCHDDRGE